MRRFVYLDNAASTYPKPPEVIKEVMCCIGEYAANPGRSGHFLSQRASETVYLCRSEIASMFNASEMNVVFTLNATTAINTVVNSFAAKGGRVVISDVEHNAVTRPLYAAGANIVRAQVNLDNDAETISAFADCITSDTKLVICTHASNILGRILPVSRIGALARSRNIPFAVDASQTAGAVDIDVKRDNIDYLCLASHKGLYGIQGTGVLIVNSGIIPEPLIFGGTGVNSSEIVQPENLPERLESGTLPTPAIAGLYRGIQFINKTGIDVIYKKEQKLLKRLYNELLAIKGIKLYTDEINNSYTGTIIFNYSDYSSEKIAQYLSENGICVRGGLHCSPDTHKKIGTLEQGAVRISAGAFNDYSDIEYFVRTIKRMLTY